MEYTCHICGSKMTASNEVARHRQEFPDHGTHIVGSVTVAEKMKADHLDEALDHIKDGLFDEKG